MYHTAWGFKCQQTVHVWTAKLSHVKTYSVYFGCSSVQGNCIENQTSFLRNTTPKAASRPQDTTGTSDFLTWGLGGDLQELERSPEYLEHSEEFYYWLPRTGASMVQRSVTKSRFWLKWVADTEYFTTVTSSSALNLWEWSPHRWVRKEIDLSSAGLDTKAPGT